MRSSKKFIGGNPVEKIINSPRDIREDTGHRPKSMQRL